MTVIFLYRLCGTQNQNTIIPTQKTDSCRLEKEIWVIGYLHIKLALKFNIQITLFGLVMLRCNIETFVSSNRDFLEVMQLILQHFQI